MSKKRRKFSAEVEYMTERIHSALDYLTPAEFESRVGISQPDPLLIQV